MSKGIFIFTFSPIQDFIQEARKTADLRAGSQILVELSKAVANTLAGQPGTTMIFPAETDRGDIPNKIVARIEPYDQCREIADTLKRAFDIRWGEISNEAKVIARFREDPLWSKIWERQVLHYWETYWAAARIEAEGDDGFRSAVLRANQTLEANKRLRCFDGALDESGYKDTLGGIRSALRTSTMDARQYWVELSRHYGAIKVRQGERLDALGTVKRFSRIAKAGFPSTSDVASADFLARVRASDAYGDYKQCLVDNTIIEPDIVVDGDLLYLSCITQEYLRKNLGIELDQERIGRVQTALRRLYKEAKESPSTYYAIVAIDGDSMGERVNGFSLEEALDFSAKLDEFTAFVRKPGGMDPAEDLFMQNSHAALVYCGGDDVLALVPLANAVEYARLICKRFNQLTGGTASAGISIQHHQSQLSISLQDAFKAEHTAKQVIQLAETAELKKDAVCIAVKKRSGAPYQVVCRWQDLQTNLSQAVVMFRGDVSTKLAYGISEEAALTPGLKFGPQQALIRRLVHRHKLKKDFDEKGFTALLAGWMQSMRYRRPENISPMQNLAKWLILARFISQGGED